MDSEGWIWRSQGARTAVAGMMLAIVIVANPAARGWASGAMVSVDPLEAMILGATSAGVTDVCVQDVENLHGVSA